MADRSTAAPWSLTRQDIRDSQRCKRDGCGNEIRLRVREGDGITPICSKHASEVFGVELGLLSTTANMQARRGGRR